MIAFRPVQSSQISGIGYDADQRKLSIKFKKKGTVYEYAAVPPEEHEMLLAAQSIGKYFHSHIRNQYVSRKLPEA